MVNVQLAPVVCAFTLALSAEKRKTATKAARIDLPKAKTTSKELDRSMLSDAAMLSKWMALSSESQLSKSALHRYSTRLINTALRRLRTAATNEKPQILHHDSVANMVKGFLGLCEVSTSSKNATTDWTALSGIGLVDAYAAF